MAQVSVQPFYSGRAYYDVTSADGQKYVFVPKEFVEKGFVQNGQQFYSPGFLTPEALTTASAFALPDDSSLTGAAKSIYQEPTKGFLWKADDFNKINYDDFSIRSYQPNNTYGLIKGYTLKDGVPYYIQEPSPGANYTLLDKDGTSTNTTVTVTQSGGGGGLFGGMFGSLVSGLSNELAKLDPSTAISRELTNLYQPVEKAVSTGLADVDKNLSLSKNAPIIAAVALAVVVPVIGAEVGASLMEAGYLTSAANASNAVMAAGGTAAQAAAAAASATATATAVGTAIASATAQVAQGVPVEDAIKNATVAATVQLNAPGAAKTVNDIVGNPAVTNLVVSTAASVVQTAATGGSEADIVRNATGALLGSGVSSATGSNIAGRAAGGAVTGGVAGALIGAAGAAGARDAKEAGTKTALDTSEDVLLAAGPGFTMDSGATGVDQYGISPEQKQTISRVLSSSSQIPNSGFELESDGTYKVYDPSNYRYAQFSADGSFLGGGIYLTGTSTTTSEGKGTDPFVTEFLSHPVFNNLPGGYGVSSTTTTTGGGATGVTGTGVSGDTGAGTAGGEGATSAPLSIEVQDKITELGGILGLGTPSSNPEGYTALQGGASGGGQSRMGILAIDKDQQQQAIIFLENLPITKPEDRKAIQNLKTAVAQTPTVTKPIATTATTATPNNATLADASVATPATPSRPSTSATETDAERVARIDKELAKVIEQETAYAQGVKETTKLPASVATPGQATSFTPKYATPVTFTPAKPQIFTPTGETDAERIARIDANRERTIAEEQYYYKKLMEGRGRGNVVVGSGADAGAGNATGNVVISEAGGGNATSNVVIDTGPGGGNAAGNVIVSDGGLGGGNAAGNVVVSDGGLGGGNAAGNVVISDGGLGGGGGNAAGNVIVGPGDGDGGGLGGNVTIDVGGGGGGNATSNVSGNVVVDEPPGDDEKPPVDKVVVEPEYKPEIFIYGGKEPPRRPRPELRTTLQGPFAPSTTLGQALTGYRGAGEIEGKKTGKPRKNVWNEESLRLKDALGL